MPPPGFSLFVYESSSPYRPRNPWLNVQGGEGSRCEPPI